MQATVPRFLLFSAMAASLLLLAGIWSTPVAADGHESDVVSPIDGVACDTEIDTETITDLGKVLAPRGNVSNYHQANFIEWQIVHRDHVKPTPEVFDEDYTEQDDPKNPGSKRTFVGALNAYSDLFAHGDVAAVAPPTDFVVQRRTDGANWVNLATVPNEPDRYVEDVANLRIDLPDGTDRPATEEERALELILRLDSVSYQGRQLTYYDTDITWPPRWPGQTYEYRIVAVYSDDCSVALRADRDVSILVQDRVPTTCVGAEHDEVALAKVFRPESAVTNKGYTVSWKHVKRANAPGNARDNLEDHQLAAPPAANDNVERAIPIYAIQRAEGTGVTNDTYFKTIADWANDTRGRRLNWVDKNIAANTAYTYRLVAIYGASCGVAFTMDTIDPTPTSCAAAPEGFTERRVRLAMNPRSFLADGRGVVVKWNYLDANDNDRGPIDGALPTRIDVQRYSVPMGSDLVDHGDYVNYFVTIASYDNKTNPGAKQTHVDATAGPGKTHYYRLNAVYADDCGVQTRNLQSKVNVPAEATLWRTATPVSYTLGPPIRVTVKFKQVYWGIRYELLQSGSEHGEYRAVAHAAQISNNYRSFVDRQIRAISNGQLWYKIRVIGPDGISYTTPDAMRLGQTGIGPR